MAEYKEQKEFERIPLCSTYDDQKEFFYMLCNRMMSSLDYPPRKAVRGTLCCHYDDVAEEYGMDRVVVVVLAFLFEMEHDDIDPWLARTVNWHIEDFENGDYRDLFQEECYQQLTDAMAKVKEYLKEYEKQHPGVLEYRPEE